MRAVAVIQARMTSSRFPGKVMRSLAGRPLLWHIATRVARAKTVDCVVVACTERKEDEVIANFCREQGLAVVRGPEDNVLERFRRAMVDHAADVYVRICGDSPLVDPDWIDRCVDTLVKSGGDYTVVRPGQLCAHEGVDVMSRRGLEILLDRAADEPVAREHITGFFKSTPGIAKVAEVDVPENERVHRRLSIDVPEDLQFFERLYASSGAVAGAITMFGALDTLRQNPALEAINAGVRQRSATEKPKTFLLYGEGGGAMGWGHLARLEVIGGALRRAGANVVFCYDGSCDVAEHLSRGGWDGRAFPGTESRGAWLAQECEMSAGSVIVIDTCGRFTASDLAMVRAKNRPVVLIDDVSERTLLAQLVLNPPAPQAATPRVEFEGEWQAGWEWVPLREDFLRDYPVPESRTLLLTMGGSDPRDFTARALAALEPIDLLADWNIRVILGASYPFGERLAAQISQSRWQVQVVTATREMAREMAEAQAILLSFGVSAYEAAAIGRPTACFCLNDDHRRHAEAFVSRGLATPLGDNPADDVAVLSRWLQHLPSPGVKPEALLLRQGVHNITRAILKRAELPAA